MTESEILFLVSAGGAIIIFVASFINAIKININHAKAEFLNIVKKNCKNKKENK